jgi:hypothetical protein
MPIRDTMCLRDLDAVELADPKREQMAAARFRHASDPQKRKLFR